MPAPFLEVRELKTHFAVEQGLLFRRQAGTVKAVDGVSFTLAKGESLGLVGESGCGKSTLGRTILQLIPATSGCVVLEGRNLNALHGRELREARRDFQMIFQDPYASLNPRMTVFDALAEALRSHRKLTRAELRPRVVELMRTVGLLPGALNKYPHEFSGGQRQRIAIARALAVEPKLIIADEPVSALDVSIQAQIINLLAKIRREMNLTLIFISHDLSVVRHIADRIAVMYLGRIVELGAPEEVLGQPLHPYTRALLSAVPIPDPARERQRQRIVPAGDPPSPMNPPTGCPFHPRCPYCIEACKAVTPPLTEWQPGHSAACIRVREILDGTAVK
ncbi:MAG: ATP-binding cassette domain-containing protein [Chthoniobacterales bacterium]|nr:ATP-binding cassette domain-containing protein [Chthoniobacterales bacterium]